MEKKPTGRPRLEETLRKLLAILQAVASVILAGVVIVAGCMATFVVLWLMLQALAC